MTFIVMTNTMVLEKLSWNVTAVQIAATQAREAIVRSEKKANFKIGWKLFNKIWLRFFNNAGAERKFSLRQWNVTFVIFCSTISTFKYANEIYKLRSYRQTQEIFFRWNGLSIIQQVGLAWFKIWNFETCEKSKKSLGFDHFTVTRLLCDCDWNFTLCGVWKASHEVSFVVTTAHIPIGWGQNDDALDLWRWSNSSPMVTL